MITSLSTRTIRTYIKNGLLNGSKKDRAWIFSKDEVEKFLHEPFVNQGIQIKNNSIVQDFIDNKQKRVNSVCSIFDYLIKSHEEVELLCDKITEQINSMQYGEINFSFSYDCKTNIARIIISGETELVMSIMQKCSN